MGIDPALLERRLDELYVIGAEPDGGAYRPLYGPAWATAVERVERWLKDAGLRTRRDAVGNLWGRAEGTDGGKSIVTGSHIDTVRHGGRLDGALGIVAGLTAVESLLKAKGKPRRTLEVVAICEEEALASRRTSGGLERSQAQSIPQTPKSPLQCVSAVSIPRGSPRPRATTSTHSSSCTSSRARFSNPLERHSPS